MSKFDGIEILNNPNREILGLPLSNINRWDISDKGYGAFWDLFKQQIVFTVLENHIMCSISENYMQPVTNILFWYNKKLYCINNNNVEYKQLILNALFAKTKLCNRIEGRFIYDETNTPIWYVVVKGSLDSHKYPINPIKEKFLFYWLKLNFYIQYLKTKRYDNK